MEGQHTHDPQLGGARVPVGDQPVQRPARAARLPYQIGPLLAADPAGAQQQCLGSWSTGTLHGDDESAAQMEGAAGSAGHPQSPGELLAPTGRESPREQVVTGPAEGIPNARHHSPRLFVHATDV